MPKKNTKPEINGNASSASDSSTTKIKPCIFSAKDDLLALFIGAIVGMSIGLFFVALGVKKTTSLITTIFKEKGKISDNVKNAIDDLVE